jgi:hypothetical protein
LGAGNLRTGPAVVASLAAWRPARPADLVLYDPSEERLDLFDRLLRRCMDWVESEHCASSSSRLETAVEGATDVIFALDVEAARRLARGMEPGTSVSTDWDEYAQYASWHGDLNHPTPPERLSEYTLAMLTQPVLDGTPDAEAMDQAVLACLEAVPADARVLSLMRGCLLPPGREHVQANWPRPLDALEEPRVPHQVLRWILGEDSLDGFLAEGAASPVVEWLERRRP